MDTNEFRGGFSIKVTKGCIEVYLYPCLYSLHVQISIGPHLIPNSGCQFDGLMKVCLKHKVLK